MSTPIELSTKSSRDYKFPVDLKESLYFEATGAGLTCATLTCVGPAGPITLGTLQLEGSDSPTELDFFGGEAFHAALVDSAFLTLTSTSEKLPSLTYKPAYKTIRREDTPEYVVDVVAHGAAGPTNLTMVYANGFAAYRRKLTA